MSWNAHVWVKCNNELKPNDSWDSMKDWQDVRRAWWTMGDWDLVLEVDCDSPDKLEEFVWKELRKKPWVNETHSTWTKEVWSNA